MSKGLDELSKIVSDIQELRYQLVREGIAHSGHIASRDLNDNIHDLDSFIDHHDQRYNASSAAYMLASLSMEIAADYAAIIQREREGINTSHSWAVFEQLTERFAPLVERMNETYRALPVGARDGEESSTHEVTQHEFRTWMKQEWDKYAFPITGRAQAGKSDLSDMVGVANIGRMKEIHHEISDDMERLLDADHIKTITAERLVIGSLARTAKAGIDISRKGAAALREMGIGNTTDIGPKSK